MKTIFSLPMDIYKNRRLVAKLAKNDFKTKICRFRILEPSGHLCSPLLPFWCTGLYFSSRIPFRNRWDLGVPFVLYLVAGIVPWFFFQDALSRRTNSMLEYNYLVKKVVFNISVLPVVKIISAHVCTCIFRAVYHYSVCSVWKNA